MKDARKFAIIIVIAVLYAILVYSAVEAIYPSPKYEDVCKDSMRMQNPEKMAPIAADLKNCTEIATPKCDEGGYPMYTYSTQGCATESWCSYCERDMKALNASQSRFSFIISSILGLIAIAAAMYLPIGKNRLNEWVATGFMIGGLIALFIGTAKYFGEMSRILRPMVILIELVIVIFVSYRKMRK